VRPLTPKPLLTRIFTIVAAMFYGEVGHDFLIGDYSLPGEDRGENAFLLRGYTVTAPGKDYGCLYGRRRSRSMMREKTDRNIKEIFNEI